MFHLISETENEVRRQLLEKRVTKVPDKYLNVKTPKKKIPPKKKVCIIVFIVIKYA